MLSLVRVHGTFTPTPDDARHITLLETYLHKHYAEQPLLNQIYVYWSSAMYPVAISFEEGTVLRRKIEALQQPDGGWKLSSLDARERLDKTSQPTASDGYATALVVLALKAHNHGAVKGDPAWRGTTWLLQHQGSDGRWQASSLNKERDPESNIGKFMSDAATGYAVLAFETAY